MSENIHAGHRNRLKEQIVSAEITDLKSPEKLLEMLLFYGIPQRDTSKMAKELINSFGSFAGVLEADIEDIVKISGITRNVPGMTNGFRIFTGRGEHPPGRAQGPWGWRTK